jgi:uncharacterized protein with von Willebrand factor type A (vWA) domain
VTGAEPGFDAVLLELVAVARRAGLRVSTSESMDALRAAAAVGLAEREDLRAALAATLVKREDDRPTFDRVFDGFFHREAAEREAGEPLGLAAQLRAEGMDPAVLDELLRRIQAAQAGAGGGLAALMQGGAELEQRLEAALRDAGVPTMQSAMQVGLFALRTLDRMGVDAMQRELPAVRAALADLGEAGERAAEGLAAQLEALRRYVRARVRRDFARANPDRLERQRAERLEREALAALSKDEIAQVSAEVRRLGRLLRDRMERRRRRARRGPLDVRGTMRSALRSGGVPFRLRHRRRKRERPELVVLCDVSDSVRTAARFLLVLVYAMQEAFAKTRSFVFVRELGEATRLFEAHPVEEAVARAFAGEVVSVAANSDYGHVFGQLVEEHLDSIGRRTTVVVLGDARSNHLDPNLAALAEVKRRAARVVWLNPEPRPSWGFGDSEMKRYLPLCSFAASVRSLEELREAVERFASLVAP